MVPWVPHFLQKSNNAILHPPDCSPPTTAPSNPVQEITCKIQIHLKVKQNVGVCTFSLCENIWKITSEMFIYYDLTTLRSKKHIIQTSLVGLYNIYYLFQFFIFFKTHFLFLDCPLFVCLGSWEKVKNNCKLMCVRQQGRVESRAKDRVFEQGSDGGSDLTF